jgi:formate hydrogenlyase subunit 6/NADH:ubiquinone oxidoreductase subunit I
MKLLGEILKRVVSKPSTRKYPKERPKIPEGFRGKVTWNKETCIFCMLCSLNCPANAIMIDREKKEWRIDHGRCVRCGRCEDLCPTKPKSVRLSRSYEDSDYKRKNLKDEFKK